MSHRGENIHHKCRNDGDCKPRQYRRNDLYEFGIIINDVNRENTAHPLPIIWTKNGFLLKN